MNLEQRAALESPSVDGDERDTARHRTLRSSGFLVVPVRIVADDLSGALEAAAAFGLPDGMPVHWRGGAPPPAGSYGFDAATRDIDDKVAEARARQWAINTSSAALNFKKVDSQLRGPTIQEIVACIRSLRFSSVIIAPSLPDEHRLMVGGVQRLEDGRAVDVMRALENCGVGAHLARRATEVGGPGVFVCDAATNSDLLEVARSSNRIAGSVLWVGSSGLARALSMHESRGFLTALGPVLTVIGTSATATKVQVRALFESERQMVQFVGSEKDVSAAVKSADMLLRSGRNAVIAVDLPPNSDAKFADAIIISLVAEVASTCRKARTLLVSGGATAATFCAEALVRYLHVVGEVAVGVPASRIVGGPFEGRTLITKSGGFGTPELLLRLVS